jgi:glutamate synthase (NADPH) large chain
VMAKEDEFRKRCNLEMVDVEPLREPDDTELLRDLLIQHAGYTGSAVAKRLLKSWKRSIKEFVKVMPLDYRRVLEERKIAAQADSADNLLQAVEVGRG